MRTSRVRMFFALAVVAGCMLLLCATEAASKTITRRWDGKPEFEQCTWDGNVEVADDGTVRLKESVLLQDEQGATHYNNAEALSNKVWAKKLFVIDDPRCEKAELFVFASAARVACNGTALSKHRGLPSTGWQVWEVPPELLQKGTNEFVMSGGGRLVIEHSLYPNRSAKSVDGGKTWDFDRMGFGGVENGEYLVRLRLKQYPRAGTITSQVFDLADLGGAIRPQIRFKAGLLATHTLPTSAGSIETEVRSGPSRIPDESWSAWGISAATSRHQWRQFAQWRAHLKTNDVTQTPALEEMRFTAEVEPQEVVRTGEAPRINVLELTEVGRQRRSHPFAYQPPGGRLRVLRERYRLEEVVSKGKTEMEKFALLRDWVRFTAPKGWDSGTTQWCPPWDALIILEMNNPPRALCMCTHFSAVFTQCALALGYTAREVILDHHCVAEIWSNRFGKWILMDTGNSADPTLNCHFEKDGVPLNALEIRRLWKAGRTAQIEVVYTPPRGRISGDKIENQCGFDVFRRFAIPFRNNHLVSPFPGELEQGVSQYYCDVYLWWEDEAVPVESPEYGKTSCRPADFYWTLNETGIDLQETAQAAVLQVSLDTVTPNFEKFLVSIDGGAWKDSPASFPWKLHGGENLLRARSANRFGAKGIESVARLEVQ